jgi:Zn ribbon nucleic-acid-binding protein
VTLLSGHSLSARSNSSAVSAGCSSADDLVALFEDRIDEVETACGRADFEELHHNELIIRGS